MVVTCLLYCEKYLNRDMDIHRLICEVVLLVNDLPICQALRLTRKVSSFHFHVKFTCFNFLTEISGFFSSTKLQPGKSYHPSIPKELEVMDNCNSDEPILRSPNVTLWGLCTLIYVLRYLLCVLWIVCKPNLSTSSEVRKSNFE